MIDQSLREMVQSSNLNFLIGAGASTPFLPLLNDIEKRLVAERSRSKKIEVYKDFFREVILPNKTALDGKLARSKAVSYMSGIDCYKDFFSTVAQVLLRRKSTILSKQANIFTTNIDILMEAALEEGCFEYNDGFSGELTPVFSLSNFKKSISKRSAHFENVSEIPVFNLLKIHGSLTWIRGASGEILYSKLKHFDRSLLKKTGHEFYESYKRLLIVNPEKKKFEETVLDLNYYELLRMYSNELERENSILFVIGFSMSDEHIQQITFRAANSNPTLKIIIFCHSTSSVPEMKKRMNFERLKYSNVEFIEPGDNAVSSRLNLDMVRKVHLEPLLRD